MGHAQTTVWTGKFFRLLRAKVATPHRGSDGDVLGVLCLGEVVYEQQFPYHDQMVSKGQKGSFNCKSK